MQTCERWPRGLRRASAAAYLGISPSQFDKERAAGRIPAPKDLFGVQIYDRHDLDAIFDGKLIEAGNDNELNAWDAHWSGTANQNT